MNQNESLRNAFFMPTPMTISGRTSSITAAFVSAIIPRIEPTVGEIKTALDILHMSPTDLRCAYCGGNTSEWDHFHPLVENQKPTGYISEIRNLVPSCGKCNQSKGNKNWKVWIKGNAKLSPTTRKVPDLQQRIERLEQYETWGNVKPMNLQSLVKPDDWQQYWTRWSDLLKTMHESQSHAAKLRTDIQNKISST